MDRRLLENVDWHAYRHAVEQVDEILVVHPHTADRPWLAHDCAVRAAVDVDEAPHGVDRAQPVEPRLAPGRPENARQDPVPSREAGSHLRVQISSVIAPAL